MNTDTPSPLVSSDASTHASSSASNADTMHTGTPTRGPSFVGEVLRLGFIALVIVLPFRLYVATPFQVSGASMSPTFETGNYLIIDRISYLLHEPMRGDVIVFQFPKDPSKYFIKRLIAFPGEKVSVRDSSVSITKTNGDTLTLTEPYVAPENSSHDQITLTLGAEEYFVLGDNRGASADSRVWGAVPKENIVGRAFLRLMPLGQIGIFPGRYTLSTDETAESVPDTSLVAPETLLDEVRL